MSDQDLSSEALPEDDLPSLRTKWQVRFSDSDSPYAAGFMPLTSLGEMIWRAVPGVPFVVYADEEEPGKTSRVIAALVHRLRKESGVDIKVSTQTGILHWTTYKEPDPEHAGKRPPVRPVDHTRRMVIITVLDNPVFTAWRERLAAEAAAAAQGATSPAETPRGRPPKAKKEADPNQPKRPRGRPRKHPLPETAKLDLE